MEVLLTHLKRDFADFLGVHERVAVETLKDRRDTIKKDVQEKLAAARKFYEGQTPEDKQEAAAAAVAATESWLKGQRLRRKFTCPACGNIAVVGGETVSRSPVRIDEDANAISREVRVLPNRLRCGYCNLFLTSYQELKEADLGGIYTIGEEEDPIEFFGIEPEDYVDVEEIIRKYGEDYAGYDNE